MPEFEARDDTIDITVERRRYTTALEVLADVMDRSNSEVLQRHIAWAIDAVKAASAAPGAGANAVLRYVEDAAEQVG